MLLDKTSTVEFFILTMENIEIGASAQWLSDLAARNKVDLCNGWSTNQSPANFASASE